MNVRELLPEETALAFEALTELRRGRPVMATAESFVAWINGEERPQGYRLAASFVEGREQSVAVAGFRELKTLAWGSIIYIDDLVTLPEFRGAGHADRVFEWVVAEVKRLGCDELHLDSGHHRYDAHRFYLNHGMRIMDHHFIKVL